MRSRVKTRLVCNKLVREKTWRSLAAPARIFEPRKESAVIGAVVEMEVNGGELGDIFAVM